jgi:hypothetical protein
VAGERVERNAKRLQRALQSQVLKTLLNPFDMHVLWRAQLLGVEADARLLDEPAQVTRAFVQYVV